MILASRRAALSGFMGLCVDGLMGRVGLAAAEVATRRSVTIVAGRGQSTKAFLSLPDRLPAPAVLTIHDSLGLSDWYKSRAQDLAREGFIGLAIDLFPGRLARDPDAEEQFIAAADRDHLAIRNSLVACIDWLRRDPRTNGRIGVLGWSFGAWWALQTSLAAPTDCTVLYYGLKYGVPGAAEKEILDLSHLKGPLLAHFGEFDTSIPMDRIDRFWAELKAAGKPAEIDIYPANHGFGNPSAYGYDREAAIVAWKRTVNFLRSSLGPPAAPTDGAQNAER